MNHQVSVVKRRQGARRADDSARLYARSPRGRNYGKYNMGCPLDRADERRRGGKQGFCVSATGVGWRLNPHEGDHDRAWGRARQTGIEIPAKGLRPRNPPPQVGLASSAAAAGMSSAYQRTQPAEAGFVAAGPSPGLVPCGGTGIQSGATTAHHPLPATILHAMPLSNLPLPRPVGDIPVVAVPRGHVDILQRFR